MLHDERVLIIAEIGSNHNGSLETACELIEVSAGCGADVVKFQSFLADDLLAADDPNYAVLKQLELPREWYPRLMDKARSCGVRFLSTATNFTTLGWMEEDGAWGYKVASCNITHRPLLERLAAIGKPVIVSTGMARLEEIKALEAFFLDNGLADFAFLHCVSKYPTLPSDLRLENITLLRTMLSCPIGFSDHSAGTHMAVAAVALGARVLEKHISLDKTGMGMDHEVAILPDEFALLCRHVRETEAALYADPTPDFANIATMRRSLHFTRDLARGETITDQCVKIVRPEDGLLPEHLASVLGKTVAVAVRKDDPVTREVLGE